jgi:hypothetical protein
VVPGPCVATCGPGKYGTQGDCLLCAKGTFKQAIGTACSTCPAVRPASAQGATSFQKCSCPSKQIGIRNTDMAIVQRLGAWIPTDTLLRNVSGQELVYEASRSSPEIWKLIVRGAADSLTVHVNSYLMFKCGAWNECADVSVDLRGTKGSLRALSTRGVLELHGYKRREAIMRSGYMQLDADTCSDTLEQVSLWAAAAARRRCFPEPESVRRHSLLRVPSRTEVHGAVAPRCVAVRLGLSRRHDRISEFMY